MGINAVIASSRAEDQEKEDHKEQEMNAALQDVRLAAGKGDDADSQGEQEKGKISALQAERDLAMGEESDGQDGRDSESYGGED